jgi:peptide/nickel transport system substrate-binding protein
MAARTFQDPPGLRHASGNPVTVEDVKFSIERIINVRDQPQQYLGHVTGVRSSTRPSTLMSDEPAAAYHPRAGVLDRHAVGQQNGGTNAANAQRPTRRPTGSTPAPPGSGLKMTGWERSQQSRWCPTPTTGARKQASSGRRPPRRRKRHPAQALRRGDLDVAFNLIPEQIATLQRSPTSRQRTASLDYIHMALSEARSSGASQRTGGRRLRDRL